MPPQTVTPTELRKLKQFILDESARCVHEPAGQLKYRYVTPTCGVSPGKDDNALVPERSLTGHYLQMYDWDACFFSQSARHLGIDGLGRQVVANFLSLRRGDGYIPRTISPHRIWDQGDLCKPFLAQTLESEANGGSEGTSSAQFLQDLDDYLNYFQLNRSDASGLYHWRNVLESGVDDNFALLAPREAAKDEDESVTNYPDGRLIACDLSAYLVAEFNAMKVLAQKAGNAGLSAKYEGLAAKAARQIEERLWNEKLEMYCNLDPKSGAQVEIRSWTGLVPVLFGVARGERVEQVIRKNVLAEMHFFRPCGLASVAASEPLYNQSQRGLYGRAIVSNWQGPMWILPNALVSRCLLKHGFKQESTELARRVVSTMSDGLKNSGTLFENYNAETGKPLWAPNFMSWNVLALELIAQLE